MIENARFHNFTENIEHCRYRWRVHYQGLAGEHSVQRAGFHTDSCRAEQLHVLHGHREDSKNGKVESNSHSIRCGKKGMVDLSVE